MVDDDFDYYGEQIEITLSVQGPDGELIVPPPVMRYHRAHRGVHVTICGKETRELQPMTSEWDRADDPQICPRCLPE